MTRRGRGAVKTRFKNSYRCAVGYVVLTLVLTTLRQRFEQDLLNMSWLNDFICELYKHLTGTEPHENTNIIRFHTRKLELLGDLSFPVDLKNWHHLLDKSNRSDEQNILNYMSTESKLIETSRQWPIIISKLVHHDRNIAVYIDKQSTFKSVIRNVLDLNSKYGCDSIPLNKKIVINCKDLTVNDLLAMNLSELKLSLLEKTTAQLLRFTYNIHYCEERQFEDIGDNTVHLHFSLKSSNKDLTSKTVFCGAVLDETGLKDFKTTAEEFIRYCVSKWFTFHLANLIF